MSARDKIGEARARLVLKSPFFASIALHLQLKEDPKHETMATDSKRLFYNPDWVESLSRNELMGVLCHEVLHVALLHVFRRGRRDPFIWNMACDYAVNWLLTEVDRWTLPQGLLKNDKFRDMEAEEIYEKLIKNAKRFKATVPRGSLVGNVVDYEPSEDGDPSVPEQEQQSKMTIAQAATAAKFAGKLPAGLERLIHEILNPKLPWKEILSRFITQNVKNDYTWKMPNKRTLSQDLYLPQLNEPTLDTIGVIIDTSGSVCQKELDVFASELAAVFQSYPSTVIETLYVDSDVAGHQTITMDDLKFEAKGGGGTDFRPGFKYYEKEGIEPSCIIYFTDGYCDSFPENVEIPTMWIITGGTKFEPPFGEVLHISLED